jgi:hypothetical protein
MSAARRKAFLFLSTLAMPVIASAAGPIQDNSFLLEEAYNQEDGVVQHINTFQRFRDSHDWVYTFTQEWPVGGLKHQFSYTLPVLHVADAPGSGSGVGDIALNYRYQLLGDGEAKVAVAPRFTVLVPTGDEHKDRGAGATAYQVAIPMSVVVAPDLVAHSNIGYTWTPKARDAEGNKADLTAWSVGQSFVWLVNQRFNVLVEAVYSRADVIAGAGSTTRSTLGLISPGVRWSYDFDSGLQIVPGIAFPMSFGPGRHDKGVFLYLSFEHPFKH